MDLSALGETSSEEAGTSESTFAPTAVAVPTSQPLPTVAAAPAPAVVAAAPPLAVVADVQPPAVVAAAPPVAVVAAAPPLAAVAEAQPLAAVAVAPAPVAVAVAERSPLGAVLDELMAFDGSIGVALVDSQSGMVLGEAGAASNMEIAAAGASEILRARLAANQALGLAEHIADVLITLSRQVQIIHPLSKDSSLFVYMIGDKATSSLAMARYKAAEADRNIRL